MQYKGIMGFPTTVEDFGDGRWLLVFCLNFFVCRINTVIRRPVFKKTIRPQKVVTNKHRRNLLANFV